MEFDLTSFMSAVMGSGVITVVVFVLLRERLAKIPKLEADLGKLRDERVLGVEAKVKRVRDEVDELKRDGCAIGKAVRKQLETVIAQNTEIFGQLRQLNRESAEQNGIQQRNSQSLVRVHQRLDEHMENQHHG